jgi:predicted DNA-binding protein (UPF0278 family)
MSLFMVDPDKLRAKAEEKLKMAEDAQRKREKLYQVEPTRENLIAVKVAKKIVKEARAEYREWDDA